MTARKIRTPAELDALPQGVVLTSKGVSVAVKLADGLWGAAGFAGAIDSETVARCAHGYLSIVGNISAPVPAPSVVPEAAVEAGARALSDDWNPGRDPVLTAMFRDYAHTALTAALPFLTAAPSATRDEVHEREMAQVIDERDAAENMADRLAARLAEVLGRPDAIGEHSSSNDPWQNALDLPDLTAAPNVTREEVRDEIAGHPIGSGYYSTSVGIDEAAEIADALLARFTITPKEDR